MKVKDLMSCDLVTVGRHTDLHRAGQMMSLTGIRHLPVVVGLDLVGLLTQRDLLRVSVSTLAEIDDVERTQLLREIRVSEVMNTELECIGPDEDVREAIDLMMEHKYGCVPVVENGRLVGILTETDFMKLTLDFLSYDDGPPQSM